MICAHSKGSEPCKTPFTKSFTKGVPFTVNVHAFTGERSHLKTPVNALKIKGKAVNVRAHEKVNGHYCERPPGFLTGGGVNDERFHVNGGHRNG